MMAGHVEADEKFIGGKARNMHKDVKARKITGTGGKGKTMVMGILERGKGGKQRKVRTSVVSSRKSKHLRLRFASTLRLAQRFIPMPLNLTAA